MKRILLPLAVVFLTVANAQKSFNLSLNGGIAVPTGNFAKADYSDETSGFAKTGYHLNISGVYQFNKNWGAGLLVGYSQFGFKDPLSLAEGYKEDSGTDSTTLYVKGHNSNLSVLIGPYYFIPASKNVLIDIRVLGGYVNTHLAGFQVFYEDALDNSMTQKETSGGAFGLQVGAGVKYSVAKKISLHFNVDYFTSKPNMDITYENFVVNSGRRLTTYNEGINGVNATVGVGFELF